MSKLTYPITYSRKTVETFASLTNRRWRSSVGGGGGITKPYGEHTRWRLYITDNEGVENYLALSEVQMLAHPNGENLCSGGTATADSIYVSEVAANAFDGTPSSSWISGGGVFPHWIEYEFPSAVSITSFTIQPRTGYPAQCASEGELQYHDGSNWVTAFSFSGQTGWSNYEIRQFDSPHYSATPPVREYRYWDVKPYVPGGDVGVGELEFRATVGGVDQANGGTAIASSTYGGYDPASAFDNAGNTNSWAGPSAASIGYDFLTPVGVAELMMQARITWPTTTPTDFAVRYSTDGVNWTTGATIRGESAWSADEQRLFAV